MATTGTMLAIAGTLGLGSCVANFSGNLNDPSGNIQVVTGTPTPTPTPTPSATPLSAQVQRLKAAVATGVPRQVAATDPITVSSSTNGATLTGASIDRRDPMIRRLGGVWTPIDGTSENDAPWFDFLLGRSTHYTDDPVHGWAPNTSIIELNLKGDAFEFLTLGYGGGGQFAVEVDGVFTNETGYDMGSNGDGAGRWIKVQLPHSDAARRIRLLLPGRPFGGLRLDANASLVDPTPVHPSSAVFIGDSITEGAVSTQVWYKWAVQASLRLGLDNYTVSGVGSTGYLNHGIGPYHTFRERLVDVTKAVDGGCPDMAVVAGGINDAYVYTPSAIGAEALSYFQAIRTACPATVLVVFGPFSGYPGYQDGSSDPQLPHVRDAIFAAAGQVSGTYTVDTTNWVTTSNRDTIFRAQGADGPHPTDAGHAYYGQLAASAIGSIINGL